MTCNNCLHNEVCWKLGHPLEDVILEKEKCDEFKDRAFYCNGNSSAAMYRSSGVYCTNGVNSSSGINHSNAVSRSNGVHISHCVSRSDGVSDSCGVDFSNGVYASSGVNHSSGVNGSYGILNSFGVDNAIFMSNKERSYSIFGKSVNGERFKEVFEQINTLSGSWRPTFNNITELWQANGFDWKLTPMQNATERTKEEAWAGMPIVLLDYIRNLKEFDAKIFKEVTGRK